MGLFTRSKPTPKEAPPKVLKELLKDCRDVRALPASTTYVGKLRYCVQTEADPAPKQEELIGIVLVRTSPTTLSFTLYEGRRKLLDHEFAVPKRQGSVGFSGRTLKVYAEHSVLNLVIL